MINAHKVDSLLFWISSLGFFFSKCVQMYTNKKQDKLIITCRKNILQYEYTNKQCQYYYHQHNNNIQNKKEGMEKTQWEEWDAVTTCENTQIQHNCRHHLRYNKYVNHLIKLTSKIKDILIITIKHYSILHIRLYFILTTESWDEIE